MKIFLIDDNTIDLLISRKLLLKHDSELTVIEFSKAQEAIVALQDTQEALPDLVLLDLNMPGMNGWEFLEAVKPLSRSPERVFILTSSLDERDKAMAAEYPSVKGYITKPLNTESITKALDRSA
ncbi:MAG: response regulator [Tunicatimonas sp.]